MAYKNLKNFKHIFGRGDFNYIGDLGHIGVITEILLYHLAVPDGKESTYIGLLEEYVKNLDSFCIWVKGSIIPYIQEGYIISKRELARAISILKSPENKRTSISGGYLRKFKKSFLYGLSRLLEGIRLAFDPSLIPATNIDRGQLVRYFFDKKEGLGNRFLFNKQGNQSVANKLNSLNRDELIKTIKLLLKQSQVRTTRNGWIDLGSKATPIRILLIKHKLLGFGRDIVCFIFRLAEHRDYDEQLNVPPQKVRFSFA